MMTNKKIFLFTFSLVFMLLTGCSQFHGLRQPLYDEEPVTPDAEAITTYQNSGEVIGEEKEHYFRHSFSQDIHQTSMDYPAADPLLLNDGNYTIGDDLPAGRATLLGNESTFGSENNEVHVGNVIIYDEAGDVYFENLFHSQYGPLVAQVDLLPGHTIEIIGETPEITVFYEPSLPEDPYILMDPPQLLVNLGELETEQPIIRNENNQTIRLTAGIYEVGEHLAPGAYDITMVQAVHNTEMYLFREGEETRVFELITDMMPDAERSAEGENNVSEEEPKQIELQAGDKIYPNLVHALELQQVSGD